MDHIFEILILVIKAFVNDNYATPPLSTLLIFVFLAVMFDFTEGITKLALEYKFIKDLRGE